MAFTTNAKVTGATFIGIIIAGALTINQYEQQKQIDALKQPVIIQAIATPTASPSATVAPVKQVTNKLLPKVTLIPTKQILATPVKQ